MKNSTYTGLDWRPSFVWFDCNVQQTYFAKIPMRHWTPSYEAVGSSNRAAIGVQEGFLVRQDHIIGVTLRFWEAEWPSIVNLVRWGQHAGDTITFRFDQTDAGTSHVVTLWKPELGERFSPRRSAEFPHVFEVDLELRHESDVPFNVDYYYE